MAADDVTRYEPRPNPLLVPLTSRGDEHNAHFVNRAGTCKMCDRLGDIRLGRAANALPFARRLGLSLIARGTASHTPALIRQCSTGDINLGAPLRWTHHLGRHADTGLDKPISVARTETAMTQSPLKNDDQSAWFLHA